VSPVYLFVYGTLRRGCRNRFAELLAAEARFVGTGQVHGRLYDLGRHPGAVPSDVASERVRGEVFLLRSAPTLLAALDRYEGLAYLRRVVGVQLATGTRVEATTYFLRREPTAGRIRSGEWKR
jgi:gamma-glutamylcyclotransferase (GGCT)/AIG2-like uncharacterized protein YtfP